MSTKTPNLVDARIGARIRLMRLHKGMSLADLGQKLNISFQQMQKYEKGTNRVSDSHMATIAKALDVTPGSFLAQRPRPKISGRSNRRSVSSILRAPKS